MIAMPRPNEKRTPFKLYSSPEFTVMGLLYSDNRLFLDLIWPRKKMTRAFYREALAALSVIKDQCAKHGIPKLYVLVPEKLYKFESLFGFELDSVFKSKNPHSPKERLLLMKQETA